MEVCGEGCATQYIARNRCEAKYASREEGAQTLMHQQQRRIEEIHLEFQSQTPIGAIDAAEKFGGKVVDEKGVRKEVEGGCVVLD